MFQKKRNTFHGGVHPYEGKELSKDKPIVKAQPGNLLYYAVSQHIGAPAVPTVQKGDHVKAGQKIAEAGGFVSAPVYASVSGTVKGIEKKVSAAGSPVDCIVVENDGLYEKEAFEECPHWEKLDVDRSGTRSKRPESWEWEVQAFRHTSRYPRKIRQRLTTFSSMEQSVSRI